PGEGALAGQHKVDGGGPFVGTRSQPHPISDRGQFRLARRLVAQTTCQLRGHLAISSVHAIKTVVLEGDAARCQPLRRRGLAALGEKGPPAKSPQRLFWFDRYVPSCTDSCTW